MTDEQDRRLLALETAMQLAGMNGGQAPVAIVAAAKVFEEYMPIRLTPTDTSYSV